MRRFGLAALQLELGPGNNLEIIAAEIATARRRFPWIDMVMLAELASYGVSLDRAEPMPGPTEERYRALAREHGLWLVPGSLYERAGERIYNTAPVIDPAGNVVARHRKMFPFLPYERGVACGSEVHGVRRAGRRALRRLDLLRHVVPGDDAHARLDGRRGDPASEPDQHDRPRRRGLDRARHRPR